VTHGVEFRFLSHAAELGIMRERSESISSRNDKDGYNRLYQSSNVENLSSVSIVTESGTYLIINKSYKSFA